MQTIGSTATFTNSRIPPGIDKTVSTLPEVDQKVDQCRRPRKKDMDHKGNVGMKRKAFQMFSVVHFIKLGTRKVDSSLGIWEWSDVSVCCGGEFVNEIRCGRGGEKLLGAEVREANTKG